MTQQFTVRPVSSRRNAGYSVVNAQGFPVSTHDDRFGADHACAMANEAGRKKRVLEDAAPDMLAALRGLLAIAEIEMGWAIEGNDCDPANKCVACEVGGCARDAMFAARAAIAKAEGRS